MNDLNIKKERLLKFLSKPKGTVKDFNIRKKRLLKILASNNTK